MDTSRSKSAFLHMQVRRALQTGRYLPGQRIDPGTLAAEFRTSPTPVRFALYRLVGEGLIVDCARSGLYVPLPTEVALRDLYDWMERLLLMACDMAPASARARRAASESRSREEDVVKLTWKLFDSIAAAARHQSLHRALRQSNDRLAPIRRAKQGLLEDPVEEYRAVLRPWNKGDMPALRKALGEYFDYRKRLVPRIVDLLNHNVRHLH